LFSCEIRSWSLRFRQFDTCQLNAAQNNTLVHSFVPNKRAKFAKKIFRYFYDIAFFVLDYFILPHPVVFMCVLWIFCRTKTWFSHDCHDMTVLAVVTLVVFTEGPCLGPPNGGSVYASTPILHGPVEGHDEYGYYWLLCSTRASIRRYGTPNFEKTSKIWQIPPSPLQ